MKTIKILTSQHFPSFEDEINKLLKKGWKTKGDLLFYDSLFLMVLYKKRNKS